MKKKLFYEIDYGDNSFITHLDGAMEWIKADEDAATAEEDDRQYILTPKWMTDEEFENLPEHEP